MNEVNQGVKVWNDFWVVMKYRKLLMSILAFIYDFCFFIHFNFNVPKCVLGVFFFLSCYVVYCQVRTGYSYVLVVTGTIRISICFDVCFCSRGMKLFPSMLFKHEKNTETDT